MKPVRLSQYPLLTTLLLLAVLTPAAAQSSQPIAQTVTVPASSPSPQSLPAKVCLADLAFLIPLDGDGSGVARSYVMALAPFSSSPGLASGTIAVYDASNRWDVPFVEVVAAAEGQTPDPTAIVVRFPHPVRLDGGQLASLAGQDGGTCRPFSVPSQALAPVTSNFVKRIVAKAVSTKPIDALQPVPDAASVCAQPNAPSRVIEATSPETPQIPGMEGTSNRVQILVWLDDTGSVIAANVFQSSGSKPLDDTALRAAVSSRYSPRIYNCRAVGDTYVFRIEFPGV